MCGICGFYSMEYSGDWRSVIFSMNAAIDHRGPDNTGMWCDKGSGIVMGHQRLAVIDLTIAGHQPMVSENQRFVLTFNGEIYNHEEIRVRVQEKVEKVIWKGLSDTESLLRSIECFGVEETLQHITGMFAFALWDREEHLLTLSRDRMGEKPLYYGWQGEGTEATFLFGSELKALKAHPLFQGEVDRGALSLFLRHNYIPAPYSIYKGIAKLPAGHLLELSKRDLQRGLIPKSRPYWSLASVALSGVSNPWQGNDVATVNQLQRLLRISVGQQMVADVPLGAFLSGGIDSSLVVALMQEQSSQPVKTFSIGFDEAGYNEALHAKAVANHLGTDHTEYYVSPDEALSIIPNLPFHYDEPFSDSSQIPTYLVSKLAKQHVTVSLSGDAGDELFCGYNRYLSFSLWCKLMHLPNRLRGLVAGIMTFISPNNLNRLAAFLPGITSYANFGEKIHKAAAALGARSLDELYMGFVSHWTDPAAIVLNGYEPSTALTDIGPDLNGLDGVQKMMVLDGLTYLTDDILVKLDRAAMGVSLETRIPFLDHRIVEFAWSLPQTMKLRGQQSKWILRQVLYRYVPKALVERPKMGFGIPIDAWLRGPLRDWAESLLDESRLRQEGFFKPEPILHKWKEHLSGQNNWQYHLWDVLMFQTWLEEQNI
jgi:asparagine synthase (glutamine-hydrolysing)